VLAVVGLGVGFWVRRYQLTHLPHSSSLDSNKTTLAHRYVNPFNRRVWDTLPPHASLPYAWDQVRAGGVRLSAAESYSCFF